MLLLIWSHYHKCKGSPANVSDNGTGKMRVQLLAKLRVDLYNLAVPLLSTEETASEDDPDFNAVDLSEKEIQLYHVDKDCSLREFVESKGLTFKRGCVFYEFINEVESIPKDKQLIFVEKVIQACYRSSTVNHLSMNYLLSFIGEEILYFR